MSEFGVYEDEMLKKFSDQDVDRLLYGKTPESGELARLAPILRALHGQTKAPSEDRVASFAAEAAKLARSARPERSAVPGRTLTRSRRFGLALRQKLATGLAAFLLLSGMTGVAVASNHAAPGNALYGLDRALEAIGVGDGEAAERIAEAQALFNEGLVANAVAHAAEAVEVTEGDVEVFSPETFNASTALRDAASNVANGENADTQSQDVRAAVAEMLMWMADQFDPDLNPVFDGRAFGDGVASRAKMIGGAPETLPDAADNATTDNAAEGLDKADEATDNAEDGRDQADEATDNAEDGLDTADEATGGVPAGRP